MQKQKRVVWLINQYGTLPGEAWRDYRFTGIGRALAKMGYEVVWWTSAFSHHFKVHRTKIWQEMKVEPGYTIRLVPAVGYRRNFGIGRVVRDAHFASSLYLAARTEPKPDLIYSAESPICFGYAGYRLSEWFDIPLIYDQMDLWPEFFVSSFPIQFRTSLNALLYPIYASRRHHLCGVSGLVALSQRYLQAGMNECPALHRRPHAVVYNGIDITGFRSLMNAPVERSFSRHPGMITAIFAGTLGPSYDILAIIRATEVLVERNVNVRVVIAGDGPLRGAVVEAAKRLKGAIIYLGKLPPSVLCSVYGECEIGLAAYGAGSNVEMPDKIYDYCAAGLVVVCSLRGEVSEQIRKWNAGVMYPAGNHLELAEVLEKLALDSALRHRLVCGSIRMGNEFDLPVQMGKLLNVVENVID